MHEHYFTVLRTTTAVKYEATMFLYATSLAQHISHSAFCHTKPTDLVLIPLEYYTVRCWARRKKSQSWMVKETRDSCFPHPRLFPPKHSACSYISLQILGGPICSRLCQRLYTLPHSRHSLLQVKAVMDTFLYLEHKYQEPKGVSSERSMMHN